MLKLRLYLCPDLMMVAVVMEDVNAGHHYERSTTGRHTATGDVFVVAFWLSSQSRVFVCTVVELTTAFVSVRMTCLQI